jgi:RNA polymerase sigma-70 factor, ECF subfamily
LVATLEQVFRKEWGRILATLIGSRAGGVRHRRRPVATRRRPSNPRAWLMTAARNHATDRIRHDRALAAKFGLLVAGDRAEVPMNTTTFPDERLELIFTCCHPVLAIECAHPSPPPGDRAG